MKPIQKYRCITFILANMPCEYPLYMPKTWKYAVQRLRNLQGQCSQNTKVREAGDGKENQAVQLSTYYPSIIKALIRWIPQPAGCLPTSPSKESTHEVAPDVSGTPLISLPREAGAPPYLGSFPCDIESGPLEPIMEYYLHHFPISKSINNASIIYHNGSPFNSHGTPCGPSCSTLWYAM
jgi:hypothetical protein